MADNVFGNPVVTPKGILYFGDFDTMNTAEKHPNNKYPSDRFDLTMGFTPETDLSELKAECDKVAKEAFKTTEGVDMPFANGDEKSMSSMAGKIIVRAKSTKRPGLVDETRTRITEDATQPGMNVRAQLAPMSYISGKTKGVTLLLKNVQAFTNEEFESLGGGQAPEAAFGGDDDDAPF